jgi:hypothetical protein
MHSTILILHWYFCKKRQQLNLLQILTYVEVPRSVLINFQFYIFITHHLCSDGFIALQLSADSHLRLGMLPNNKSLEPFLYQLLEILAGPGRDAVMVLAQLGTKFDLHKTKSCFVPLGPHPILHVKVQICEVWTICWISCKLCQGLCQYWLMPSEIFIFIDAKNFMEEIMNRPLNILCEFLLYFKCDVVHLPRSHSDPQAYWLPSQA